MLLALQESLVELDRQMGGRGRVLPKYRFQRFSNLLRFNFYRERRIENERIFKMDQRRNIFTRISLDLLTTFSCTLRRVSEFH